MARFSKRSLLMFALLLGLVFTAQVKANNLKQAANLIENGHYEIAYNLLVPYIDTGITHPEALFLYAMASRETGRLDLAIDYFNKLIERFPDELRPKLELAVAYFMKGDYVAAKQLVGDLDTIKLPAEVRKNLNQLKAAIEAKDPEKSQFRMFMQAGLIYNDNINTATNSDIVNLFGIDFNLNEEAKPQSDTASTFAGQVNHRYLIDETLSISTDIALYHQDNRDLSSLDISHIYLGSGAVINYSPFSQISLPFHLSGLKLGHENRYYTYSYGFKPKLTYIHSPVLYSTYQIGYERTEHYDSNRYTTRHPIEGRLYWLKGEDDILQFGVSLTHISDNFIGYGKNEYGINARWKHEFSESIDGFISGKLQLNRHQGIMAAHLIERQDRIASIEAGLGYLIPQLDETRLNLTFNHMDNHSNLELYDYTSNEISLTITKQW